MMWIFDNDRIRVIRKGGSESFVYFGDEVREALLNYLEERKNLTPDEGHENALFISAKKKPYVCDLLNFLLRNMPRLLQL